MGKRVLYVGGLPDEVSDCELRGIFTSYGLVARAYVVRFKHTGRSAGYGFDEEGIRLVEMLGKAWIPGKQDGRIVQVQFNLPLTFKLE